MSDKKSCFVACPIGELDSVERKRSDKLLRHILKPVLDELGYEIVRADQIQSAGRITTQVLQVLNDADIVVADLTDENPNVMYELGIRHAIRKPFIHMMEKGSNIPFDVYDVRTIFYRLDLDSVDDARAELKGQIGSIERGEWTVASPVNFVVPEGSSENNEQVMIASLHQ
ncbi:MAG: nucleoside 2-deoxyribosyltransferase, partial [Desertifilum sp. SIO1I2]|nr:nucleoside 2-deoxyribosyltransferase [Desertifilum sp. SIO1I2]